MNLYHFLSQDEDQVAEEGGQLGELLAGFVKDEVILQCVQSGPKITMRNVSFSWLTDVALDQEEEERELKEEEARRGQQPSLRDR